MLEIAALFQKVGAQSVTAFVTISWRFSAGLVPKATKDCVSCGLCVEKCPAGAISRDDLKTADSKKCISCMHCIAVCPTHSRINDEAVVSRVGQMLEPKCSVRKANELFL